MERLARLVALIIAITSASVFATMFGATSIKFTSLAHAADSRDDQVHAVRKRRPAKQKVAKTKKEGSPENSCWTECIAEAFRSTTAKGCTARCSGK